MCDICGAKLSEYIQDESGKCYCSEKCYEAVLPKCTVCHTPMKSWTATPNGEKYCSERCFVSSWPKCASCGKPMKEWFEKKDGKKYCSEICFDKSLNKCCVCHKPLRKWIESEGKQFCSHDCFLECCPTCSVCGVHMEKWIYDEEGHKYCSDKCRDTTLPICSVCGKRMSNWYETPEHIRFCSEKCYELTLPRCMNCGKPMKQWIRTVDGRIYCSENCMSLSDEMITTIKRICRTTGLSGSDVEQVVIKNNWSLDETLHHIEVLTNQANKNITSVNVAIEGFKNAGVFEKLANKLSSYNTMRGGENGLKGFLFEDLHVADATLKGKSIDALGNNGLADFVIKNSDGSTTLAQAKVGYNSTSIDWSKYKGQTIVIDKGNTKLIESARKAGLKVIESDVSKVECDQLAKTMQFESKITGNPKAPITANVHAYHRAGVESLKKGVALGAGFSLACNIVDLVNGEKDFGEAAVSTVADVVTAAGSGYVIGVGSTVIANTAAGSAAITLASNAGMAVAQTTLGTTLIGAGSAAATTVSGLAAAAGSTIASTTLGGAAVACGSTVVGVVGSTAAGAAVIAAAPLVAVGVVCGLAYKCVKSFFD